MISLMEYSVEIQGIATLAVSSQILVTSFRTSVVVSQTSSPALARAFPVCSEVRVVVLLPSRVKVAAIKWSLTPTQAALRVRPIIAALPVAGNLLQAGVGELIGGTKNRTFSHESDRSRQVNDDFRYSRSQQSAEYLQMLQKGKRNL